MSTTNRNDNWRLPDLIDVGMVRARHSVTLPLVIQTPGPAQIRGELSGLTVFPTQTTGGEQLIQLRIAGDHLFKDTLLTGQMAVRAAGETRIIWIIGRVLEDEFQQWAREVLRLTAPSNRKFLARAGMVLGKHHLAGEPGAEQLPDSQAYLRREESGAWALFQPRPSNTPLVVNGQLLAVGQRLLVIGGETIGLGKLTLQVEAYNASPALLVDSVVDFGRLSVCTVAQLTIKNRSSQPWQGMLKVMVPWIVAPNPIVSCPGRQSISLALQLGRGIPDVSGQQINLTGALLLEGQQEVWSIGATLLVDARPEEVLTRQAVQLQQEAVVSASVLPLAADEITVLPSSPPATGLNLDFGVVSNTAVESAVHQICFINTSPQVMSGRAWVNDYFWLEITPSTFICLPGQAVTFTVKLNKFGADLRPKRYNIEDAILVEYNGQQTSIRVCLEIQRPGHQVEATPPNVPATPPLTPVQTIDFGTVNNFSDPLPVQTFRLSNPSSQIMTGTVRVNDYFWLEVTPTSFTCPPGQEVVFTVTFNQSVATIRPKQYHVTDAILVESSGQRQWLAVAMTIVRPTSS